jgi:hypothetical protein
MCTMYNITSANFLHVMTSAVLLYACCRQHRIRRRRSVRLQRKHCKPNSGQPLLHSNSRAQQSRPQLPRQSGKRLLLQYSSSGRQLLRLMPLWLRQS